MSKYSKNARAPRWSDSELEKLKDLYETGKPHAEIGFILGRSPTAVAQKLKAIGLTKHSTRYVEWTESEVAKLKKIYGRGTTKQIVKILPKHSLGSIQKKAEQLGLVRKVKDVKKWSREELDKLYELYDNGISVDEISNILNRTVRVVKLKIGKINAKNLFWSPEEISILHKLYDSKSNEELELLLPKRSASMIAKKANSLGLYKPPSFLWSLIEIKLLKNTYPIHTIEELLGIFPNKTKNQINKKAKRVGLKKTLDTLRRCYRLAEGQKIPSCISAISRWRHKILKRDQHTCQECGLIDDTGMQLHAHHIIPQRDCSKKKKYDINNGIILCIKCHKKVTNQEYRYANKYQLLLK